MRLIIRTDANFKIGFGHIMRCLALAQYWRDHMGPVSFICHRTLPKQIESRLDQEGFNIQFLSVPAGSAEDAKQLIAYAHDLQAKALFIDGYHFKPSYQRFLFDSSLYTLVMDDEAHLNSYWADGLLNQNPGITAEVYRERISKADLLLGPRYALLRQEILSAKPTAFDSIDPDPDPDPDPSTIRLLITLGGTNPDGLIQKILDALVHLSSDHPLNVKLLSPTTNLQPTPSWVQQIPYTDDMATLYRWTNLAICGGGSTQWEMSFFGIPRLAIILADNQLSTTEFLHQNQCCINAGRYETLTKSSLIENLKLLFSNHAMRVAMREKNQSLIDGQGVKRVCEFIQARIPCPK